MRIKHY